MYKNAIVPRNKIPITGHNWRGGVNSACIGGSISAKPATTEDMKVRLNAL